MAFPGNPALLARTGHDTPVGAVVAYTGAVPASSAQSPSQSNLEARGWMFCDGRTLSGRQYPELFQALGHLYGGSGEQFQIPDYRGYFLRGNGTGTEVDPDIAMRRPSPGAPHFEVGVGSTQPSAVQVHEHAYTKAQTTTQGQPGGMPILGQPLADPALTEGGPVGAAGAPGPVGVSHYETRPVNIYVNYIIKYA